MKKIRIKKGLDILRGLTKPIGKKETVNVMVRRKNERKSNKYTPRQQNNNLKHLD